MTYEGYGAVWQRQLPGWWGEIYDYRARFHKEFYEWMRERIPHCKTVLEIGCGSGVYPERHPELFEGVSYTGIDISAPGIAACKRRPGVDFILGDFMDHEFDEGFDMVFSHAVIDHVYEPERFVVKVAKLARKYALVDSYRGCEPHRRDHSRSWDHSKQCYDGILSPGRLVDALSGVLPADQFNVCRGPGECDDLIVEITRSPMGNEDK